MKNQIKLILTTALFIVANAAAANHGIDPIKQTFKKWNKQFVAYPKAATVNNEQGVVYVSFELSDRGEAKNINVEKGLSAQLNLKAIQMIEKMPKSHLYANGFIEGTQFIVPVKFQIEDKE